MASKQGLGGCPTGRLVEVGEVGQVVASLEHRRVHQRRQLGRVVSPEVLDGDLDRLGLYTSPQSAIEIRRGGYPPSRASYLAIFQVKDERDLVAVHRLLGNLGRNPALGDIGLPGPRPDIIALRHWARFVGVSGDGRSREQNGSRRSGCRWPRNPALQGSRWMGGE
jgi:hypothetical protein